MGTCTLHVPPPPPQSFHNTACGLVVLLYLNILAFIKTRLVLYQTVYIRDIVLYYECMNSCIQQNKGARNKFRRILWNS